MKKQIRHYYWLISEFITKHAILLLVSFVTAFIVIFLMINIFPFISTSFLKKKSIIGRLGNPTLNSIPDDIARQISSPLITIDQDGNIQPLLAHSWELRDGNKTYRFHLRNDLYWNDNKRFTAYDVKYKFPDVEIVPLDDFTVEFRLKEPLQVFPIYLTQPLIKYPLIGIGPLYDVDAYKSNKTDIKSISMSPNKPDLPYKVYKFYTTESELITAYKKSEIDTFETANPKTMRLFENWNNTDIKRTINYNAIMTLFMNTQSGMLQERDVRKAIAYAIPSYSDEGVPAKSPIPPQSWAHTNDVKEYPYNQERASDQLDNFITASDSATLQLATFYEHIDVAEKVEKDLEAVGLNIDVKIVSAVPTDYDLFLTLWSPPSDPDQYFFWHSTQEQTNLTKLDNKKIDKFLEDGRRILNIKQRQNIYTDFQKTIAEEVPAYFMYHPYEYVITRK